MAWYDRRDNGSQSRRTGHALAPRIAIGQRYADARSRRMVWEVVALSRYADEPIPHARLVRVDAPYDTKTVSVEALSDRRFFRPADEF